MKATGKRFLDQNVYEAAVSRLHTVFDNFERVCVAFSGGKDSTVLLHLALQVARERKRTPVHAFLLDLEGQYQTTIDHVAQMFSIPDVKPWWVCLPINLRNASSAIQPYWCAWEPGREADWVRPMPDHPSVISRQNYFPFYRYRMEFEQFVPAFDEWLAQRESIAFLVGIRADESMNRYRAVRKHEQVKKSAFKGINWSSKHSKAGAAVSFYPIYDWRFADIWHYIHVHRLPYNRLYDYMYQTGMPFSQMRICQPYGDDQRKGLDLFHKIEPDTWFRIVRRVEGANYAARYSRQKFLGYHGGVGLPPTFTTWRQYCDFLLKSLPPSMRSIYTRRLKVFIRWWQVRGYPLTEWPDAGEPALENKKQQPSWRRVAVSILKLDLGRSLSFGYAKRDADMLVEVDSEWKKLPTRNIDCG